MADAKITDLADGGAVQDTDEFVVARAGANNKIAGSKVKSKQSYIGKNAVGANADASAVNTWKGVYKKVTTSSDGLLASIDVHCKGNGSNVSALYAAVFDDNAGAPGKLISVGTFPGEPSGSLSAAFNTVMSATARWVSIPSGIWLPAGTYWMVVCFGGAGVASAMSLFYDAGGHDFSSTLNATWINEATASADSTRDYSIRGNLITL
jgi:hypothetical protein